MEREAVAFTPVLKGEKNLASQAATQLNDLIADWEERGWRFCHLENVNSFRPAGCLGGLFGSRDTTIPIQVAIFERD